MRRINDLAVVLLVFLASAVPASSAGDSVDLSAYEPVSPWNDSGEMEWLGGSPEITAEDCNIVIAARAVVPKLVVNSGGPQSTIRGLAFSPDGERLYSAGLDKVVQVWGFQVEARNIQRTAQNRGVLVQQLRWEIERGPNGQIYAIAASPTDRRLALGGFGARVTPTGPGGDVIIYDTARGEIDRLLQGHSSPVIGMDYAPSGKRLVTAGRNGQVMLWDEAKNWQPQELRARGRDESVFIPVRFLSEDVVALPVHEGDTNRWRVGLYDVRKPGDAPKVLDQIHANAVTAIAIDRPRKRFVTSDMTADGKGNIYLWTGLEKPQATPFRAGRLALSMDFDPAGRLFVATALFPYRDGTKQSTLEMWNIETRSMEDQVEISDREPTQACRVSPDGSRVVTFAGHDNELRVYLLKDRAGNLVEKPLAASRPLRLRGRGRPVQKVAFAEGSGYRVGFTSDVDKTGRAGSLADGFDFDAMATLDKDGLDKSKWVDSEKAGDWSAKILDSGRKVVVAKGGEPWATIDMKNTEGIARCHAFLVPAAGGSPYAMAIGTAVQNGVFVYGIRGKDEPCRLLRYFRDHSGFVNSLSVSPDGKYLASGSMDQTIKVWSLEGLGAIEGKFGPGPGWGANFVFENGQIVARDVLEAGTAARKGIRERDVIVEARFVPELMRRLGAPDPSQMLTDPKKILEGLESSPLTDLLLLTVKRRGSVLSRQVLMMPAWEPVVTLFVDDKKQWAAFTPKGYYDSSVAGDELFGWQINRGQSTKPDFFRADQFRRQLERSAAMKKLLTLGSMEEALRRVDEIPDEDPVTTAARSSPRITIVSPTDAQILDGQSTPLVAKIEYPDETSVEQIKGRAYVNGVPGKEIADRRNATERTYEWNADIRDTYNRLRVVADNSQSEPVAYADVHFRLRSAGETRKPKLHVFAIAASKYKHVAPLEFPVKDAESIVELLRAKTGELYALGQVKQLYDDAVTREGVDKAVEDWRSNLAGAQSDDLLVVFLAGHGVAVDGQYFFVPTSTEGPESVPKTGVAWDSLRRLGDVPCKKLVLLDTCHSGNVLPIRTAGSAPLKAAIRPLKQDDIMVLAATDVGQEAIEIGSLGHGVFTQALLDGFGGAADSQKDNEVDLQEIAQYVEAEVPSRTRQYQLQTPKSFPSELMNVISVPIVTLR